MSERSELAVKSRKGDFGFWELNLGVGHPFGATVLGEKNGGKEIKTSYWTAELDSSLRSE